MTIFTSHNQIQKLFAELNVNLRGYKYEVTGGYHKKLTHPRVKPTNSRVSKSELSPNKFEL